MKKFTIISIFILVICLYACQTVQREEPFQPSLKSPSVQIGEIEAQFEKFLLPGIRKLPAKVFYYPDEDAVAIQWRMDMITYNQFWSYEGRQLFIEGLEEYKQDFEDRNFGKNSRKAKMKYGRTKRHYIYWQTVSIAVLAHAPCEMQIGYYFQSRSPYFVANQRHAEFIDPMSRDNYRFLNEMTIYFTRAQANALAALFDQQMLSEIKPIPVVPVNIVDQDAYYEPDEPAEPQKPDTASDKDEY